MLWNNGCVKWCAHCQKHDHNDDECWSTRMVDPYAPNPFAQVVKAPAGAPIEDVQSVAFWNMIRRNADRQPHEWREPNTAYGAPTLWGW